MKSNDRTLGRGSRPGRPRTRQTTTPRDDAFEAPFGSDSRFADDALGLYLKQMGSVPLLSAQREATLTRAMGRLRQRYRRAALFNWPAIARVVEIFQTIGAGGPPLDRTVDVVPGLGLTVENIRARLPGHLAALRKLLKEARARFARVLGARKPSRRTLARRTRLAQLREAVRLAEELSPRIELLDAWTDDLWRQAARLGGLAGAERRAALEQVLARPEELEALVDVQRRRQAAYRRVREELVEANLRLVVSIAKRYRGRGLPFSDLIQEGNGGLMRAVDKYDYRVGVKFGTYATWWIRQGVTRAVSEHGRTIRVPCHHGATLKAIDQARGDLALHLGREPSEAEVAGALGLPLADLRVLTLAGRHPLSLDETFKDQEDNWSQLLGDANAPGPGEGADQHLLRERLDEMLRSLPARDRDVLELRFGLKDGRQRTLEEVSRVLGVTRERVRQLEARGLEKLRQPDRRLRLMDFADRD
jgi:RNA polymerase primary sigma factor